MTELQLILLRWLLLELYQILRRWSVFVLLHVRATKIALLARRWSRRATKPNQLQLRLHPFLQKLEPSQTGPKLSWKEQQLAAASSMFSSCS